MNTFFVAIFFNFLFLLTRSNISASEKDEREKALANSNSLIKEYYDSGEYAGLIKHEFHIAEDGTTVLYNRYFYDENEMIVYDLFDNKTIYRKDAENNLVAIEKCDLKGNPYSIEKLIIENQKIVRKTFEDVRGNALICERYFYDNDGNLIKSEKYLSLEELAEKIENDILPANETFQYLNELLKAENLTTIQEIAETYLGPLYLMTAGYYNHPLESGIFGFGEAGKKVRITFINGILNRNSDCMETARLISKTHGGTNVHYIYRPTTGWANDLMQAVSVRFGYLTPQATLLANRWKELIADMGGVQSEGVIIHYAHSIGASDTWNARTLLTPEEKNMIRVITIGSPFMIHKDGLHSVVNFVSMRDGVSLLDPFGYFKGHLDEDSSVVFLGSVWEGLPFVEHPINSPSYLALIYNLGKDFISMFGAVELERDPVKVGK